MIVTFYSFADEPVRAHLLTLVSSLLVKRGFSVLVVDFDFGRRRLSAGIEQQPGVLEILDNPTGHSSWRGLVASGHAGVDADVLGAGRWSDLDGRFAEDEWEHFFLERNGGGLIEALRDEWHGTYDVVLVDSPAGTGHAAGVSTIQLADAVVACVTATAEGVDGTMAIVEQIQHSRERFDFDRSPATIVPVPVGQTVHDIEDAASKLARYCGSWLPRAVSPVDIVRSLAVPSGPSNAAGESPGSGDTGGAVGHVARTVSDIVTGLFNQSRSATTNPPGHGRRHRSVEDRATGSPPPTSDRTDPAPDSSKGGRDRTERRTAEGDRSVPVSIPVPVIPGCDNVTVLAWGGVATVYRALQISVGREVAVKVENRTLEGEKDRRRFVREARAAGGMSSHPHVVDLFDVGVTPDGHPYMIMELCLGTYAERMKTDLLSAAECREVGAKIADALADAHALGMLHRDVKPANILITRFGEPALADFGLAVLAETRESSITMELTPAYAAPEIFHHERPLTASDVYSLCATLYALMQGRPPRWRDNYTPTIASLIDMFAERVPDIPGVPTDLTALLRRGMANNPAARPTAAELRDELAGFHRDPDPTMVMGFPAQIPFSTPPEPTTPQWTLSGQPSPGRGDES
jgi:cellulose biosynthesis protein BcsQ